MLKKILAAKIVVFASCILPTSLLAEKAVAMQPSCAFWEQALDNIKTEAAHPTPDGPDGLFHGVSYPGEGWTECNFWTGQAALLQCQRPSEGGAQELAAEIKICYPEAKFYRPKLDLNQISQDITIMGVAKIQLIFHETLSPYDLFKTKLKSSIEVQISL